MKDQAFILNRRAFQEDAAPSELVELNESIASFQRARPSPWSLPLEDVRKARREGRGVFPAREHDAEARDISVPGRDGYAIPVRLFHPFKGGARGTYLHIHGGGWVFGDPRENDMVCREMAEETGLVVASVDYRLAPEHTYPAGPNDCEDVGLALSRGEIEGLPTDFLAIGGESAGAHLSVLTLIRLRDWHGIRPFGAANLVAGCFDLSLTPSVRNFGAERLVLNTDDIKEFVLRFVPDDQPLKDPGVSPLYADLKGLPPALFSVGTRDLLLDDTLFMAARWLSAGNEATLSVWTGGCHVFQAFDNPSSNASRREMTQFIKLAQDSGGTAAGAIQ